ncbi:MAG: helix-turn-helix transcriptional regulator, partial [Mesorhizobium sp.]
MLQAAADTDSSETLTERQQAVLDAALRLLVEEGDNLTMTAVARRASCSKETLYKWFGD